MKIMFISEKSILDLGSGAAIELLAWLRILAAAGHECHSFTFSCFDGQRQYPVRELVSSQIDLEEMKGKVVNVQLGDGIDHQMLVVPSTRTEDLRDPDFMAFHMNARARIEAIRPDILLLFGSNYLEPLVRRARELGSHAIFYLATGTYTEKSLPILNAVNEIVVPGKTLQKFYRDRLDLKRITVLPTLPNHDFERSEADLPELARTRRDRFVTMVNPVAAKGGLIFINIANRFQTIDPAITFLAVESRGQRGDWVQAGVPLSTIRNMWWIPKQLDMAHVFRKTSVLVVPSIAYEAAGKVVSEAMICGIPVVAANTGGIPEQMRGAGTVIDIPDEVRSNPNQLPVDFVSRWVEAVQTLLDDEETYLEAARKSLKAGRIYQKKRRARELVKLLESRVKA